MYPAQDKFGGYQQGAPSAPTHAKRGTIQNLHNPPRPTEVQREMLKARAFHGALDQQVQHKQQQQHYQLHQQQKQARQRHGSDVYIYDMRTESSGTSLDIGGPPRQMEERRGPAHFGHLDNLFNPPTESEMRAKDQRRAEYVNGLNQQLMARSNQGHQRSDQIMEPLKPQDRLAPPPRPYYPHAMKSIAPMPNFQPYRMPAATNVGSLRVSEPVKPMFDWSPQSRVVPFESIKARSGDILANLSSLHRELQDERRQVRVSNRNNPRFPHVFN